VVNDEDFAARKRMEYNDEYATCEKTHVTLCVYPPENMMPEEVTATLGIAPTETHVRGDLANAKSGRTFPVHSWFLCTKGSVESRDSRRHLDWLLDRVLPVTEKVRALESRGARVWISCYWVSASGHGGPSLLPVHLKKLSELGVEFWYDFYGPYEEQE